MSDSEPDDSIEHLALELDASGADERVAELEDSARKLSDHLGGHPVEVSYTEIVVPVDAEVTDVVEWPHGEVSTVRAFWR